MNKESETGGRMRDKRHLTVMKLTELPEVDNNQDSYGRAAYGRRVLVANILHEENSFGFGVP